MAGKIELMLGPMRSNKTAELLRRAEMRRQYAKQYVLVLKPSDDTKGGPGVVESRNPNGHAKMNALEFNVQRSMAGPSGSPSTLNRRLASVWSASPSMKVSLSTISFCSPKTCSTHNHDVLVAGLDLDFRAIPFGEMLNLTWLVNAYGGSITECMAYCSCGARALYSQRLIEGKPAPYDSPIKMPGDSYEPRCAEHFVLPGRPH